MYVDVLVPLPLEGSFTYFLPPLLEAGVQIGSRVVVPFGAKRHYTGIVTRLHDDAPAAGIAVKAVISVLDTTPLILPSQLTLWKWMADYYLCTEGEVLKAALPTGFNIESDTLQPYYHPKYEQHIRLGEAFRPADDSAASLQAAEEALAKGIDVLARAKKQQDLMLCFLDYVGYANGRCERPSIARTELLERSKLSATLLNALIARRYLEPLQIETSRLTDGSGGIKELSSLSSVQQKAYEDIKACWQQKAVCLLHGVTSSGKTEIYIHLIQEAIDRGEQVLYLMPEIALTTQMEHRLRAVFGSHLGVYHSRFSDAERVEIWRKQLSDEPYDVILGVRSSVFLPFQRLGLVVVDEEHENSYKQQDPSPRYHARNVALVLAARFGAKTLLGSATPSLESYHLALEGRYGLAQLTERYRSVLMPEIEVVDIAELWRKHRMEGSFSPRLLEAIKEALANDEQVILFQNRRGYAPVMECHTCGWVPRCERCDVALTYHRRLNLLQCHYCGNTYRLPTRCPQCEEENIRSRGVGTEKVEEELQKLIPTARIDRMDLDTTRSKSSHERILTDFAKHRTDILIGTQMVSKGLDFENVSVVGIINADNMLSFPDFRAYERAFQLMAQVAGRAGRRRQQGRVILQTRSSDLPLIHQVRNYDYEGMYRTQMAERELFCYPPFSRLLFIYLRGRDERHVAETANRLRTYLQPVFGPRVMGPEAPPVGRVQGLYIQKLMLKMELSLQPSAVRTQLKAVLRTMADDGLLSGIIIHYDVDPM